MPLGVPQHVSRGLDARGPGRWPRSQLSGTTVISFITPTRHPEPTNIRRIAGMLPRGSEFIVVSVPGGAAHARNVGAAAASGEVFVFVDDDVHLECQWNWDEWLTWDWQFAIASLYWPAPEVNVFMMRLESTMLSVLQCVFRYKLFMSGFAAVRREAFEAVGGYRDAVTFEEHSITMDFYNHHFRGARLPVRVNMLRRWQGWKRINNATSRGKSHPPPKDGEVVVRQL